MFRLPGGSEWIIILIIVILIFGPGRIGKIAGEIGRSIKLFREGIGNKDEAEKNGDVEENK
jgi:sec-independent protein translocase protein TatA